MPMGVAQITVFDKNGIPRAERLVFLNQDKKINIIPRSLKEVYEKKEIVNIDLVAQNNLYEAIPGVFSVSVSPVFSETTKRIGIPIKSASANFSPAEISLSS